MEVLILRLAGDKAFKGKFERSHFQSSVPKRRGKISRERDAAGLNSTAHKWGRGRWRFF